MKKPRYPRTAIFMAAEVRLGVALLLCLGLAGAQEVRELKSSSNLEIAISGGQTQDYRIALSKGQFLYAMVDQKGIDVEVTLVAPGAKQVAHMDSLNSTQGPEPIAAIAEATGEYRLRVSCSNPQAAAGRYVVRVLAVREATADDKLHVAADRNVDEGISLLNEGKAASLNGAAEKIKAAIPFYHLAGLRYDEALALYTLGVIEAQIGDFRAALESYQLALSLFQAVHASSMEGGTILNMGGAYDVQGDLPGALAAYQRALPLLKSSGDLQSEAAALNNIGKIYADMAEWQQSSEYYKQALPIFHAYGDRQREGTVLINLGRLSSFLGQRPKAIEYFQEALKLTRAVGNKRGEAEALLNLATIYRAQDQLPDALKLYGQALELSRSAGDHLGEASILTGFGSANAAFGRPQQALEQFQQSLLLFRGANDRRGEGLALSYMGPVYASMGQPEQALKTYQQALAILNGVGDRHSSAETLQGIALVERTQGRLPDARKHSEQALALVEKVRETAGAQDDRASYFATQQSMGEFYIDLLMRMHAREPEAGHDVEAFEAAERQRARSLLEMLAEARVDIRQGADPKLLEREHVLGGLLNSDEQRLLSLHGAGAEDRATALKKEIGEREGELQQVQIAIRRSSPQYSAIRQPEPLTARAIQQQVLDGDTVLLEYALGDDHSYLWVVSTTGLKSYELPRRSEIERSVREVVELLSARGAYVKDELTEARKRRIIVADARLPEAAARLSTMVLGPAAAELGTKRLALVTDGSLQHVPFAMLPIPASDESAPRARLLVEDHEIVSLPSASTLWELRKQIAGRESAPKRIAVFADPVFRADDPRVGRQPSVRRVTSPLTTAVNRGGPAEQNENSRILVHLAAGDTANSGEGMRVPRLPFTRQEANRIIRLAGPKDTLEALDFRASLATATSGELARYRYLHFATHGYLDSEQPELSAVVLALVNKDGQPQSGFLRANDIYNLKLPADLIVLSACETGLGKELRGEGIIGLTRAFMYAGAPRVVVSLWSVNDRATEELMATFYKKLFQEKLAPAAALRQAQLAMTRDRVWSPPYFWAAFVLQGEWK